MYRISLYLDNHNPLFRQIISILIGLYYLRLKWYFNAFLTILRIEYLN